MSRYVNNFNHHDNSLIFFFYDITKHSNAMHSLLKACCCPGLAPQLEKYS